MKKWLLLLLYASLSLLIFTSCAPAEQETQRMDYDQTKKMVVDILKTDEGKKAIEQVMNEEEVKQQLIMDQAIVKDTIQNTLTSEKGSEFWKKIFEDPKFAESFAKSLQKEQEKIIKQLMKDPDFQKSLIELFQNPEMEKQMLTVLKSQEYRSHIQKIMTETFESPLYKAKIQDLLLKAAEEVEQGNKEQQKGSEEEGGSQEEK
ncbi:spore germination lipoprotein GerD [Priestia abyssalis]|uniref:spore germination lipoprotein GerD n=1 Tax=Priestia abyssalis TaxID=1221450 RepID=UPI0009952150|nr:spore germination lipoprotein GerD [Priestia abyssalis]